MKNIKAEDIRKGLMELRDEKYREFHSGLVPGEDKIIGIRIPVIRKYARELFKEYHKDVDLLLENTGVEYYEEKVLKGMLIGMEKKGDVYKRQTCLTAGTLCFLSEAWLREAL